ncbi:MAG TPA: hypothetical protein VFT79_12920 [Solirubrobacterales bacterium]|nr:hypothetical protein [Solirubrobacterales bacterium]
MAAFSKRHSRAIEDGRLKPEVSGTTRGRIRRLLERHNESYRTSTDTGFNYETDTIEDLAGFLRDLHGADKLVAKGWNNEVEGLIEEGPASRVFDAVELFAGMQSTANFVVGLNEIFSEEEEPWRMLNEEIVLLDEAFAHSELASRVHGAIEGRGFAGASQELQRARNRLVDGDGRGVVHSAGAAFESVMMALLEAERGKGAKLLQDLNRDGFFDALPKQLRQKFIREVLEAMPWMRNELGGHGQGGDTVEVPPPYAQLALDLAASFSHFLISLQLEREGETQSGVNSAGPDEAEVPVTVSEEAPFVASSEDDIPF